MADLLVPDCGMQDGCSPYCDLGLQDCGPGETCASPFAPGEAPAQWAQVGVCVAA